MQYSVGGHYFVIDRMRTEQKPNKGDQPKQFANAKPTGLGMVFSLRSCAERCARTAGKMLATVPI
jgi:hypothetical protein